MYPDSVGELIQYHEFDGWRMRRLLLAKAAGDKLSYEPFLQPTELIAELPFGDSVGGVGLRAMTVIIVGGRFG